MEVVVVENGIHNHNPFHKKECKGILAPSKRVKLHV